MHDTTTRNVTVICKEIDYETHYEILPFFGFLSIRSKKLCLSKCEKDELSRFKNRTYFEYHITLPTFRNNLRPSYNYQNNGLFQRPKIQYSSKLCGTYTWPHKGNSVLQGEIFRPCCTNSHPKLSIPISLVYLVISPYKASKSTLISHVSAQNFSRDIEKFKKLRKLPSGLNRMAISFTSLHDGKGMNISKL